MSHRIHRVRSDGARLAAAARVNTHSPEGPLDGASNSMNSMRWGLTRSEASIVQASPEGWKIQEREASAISSVPPTAIAPHDCVSSGVPSCPIPRGCLSVPSDNPYPISTQSVSHLLQLSATLTGELWIDPERGARSVTIPIPDGGGRGECSSKETRLENLENMKVVRI